MADADQRTTLRELLRVVFVYKHLVVGTAVLFALAAAAAAYWSPDQYEASARLWVRDETATLHSVGESPREQYERIQVAAANLREAMLSRAVLHAVLSDVLGDQYRRLTPEAQEAAIKRLRRRVRFLMARSSEFGASQVIAVSVRDESREQARELLEHLLHHTEALLQQVGRERARQLLEKTEREWRQAQQELHVVQERLSELVRDLGSDLLDVQAMGGSPVGESGTRQLLREVQERLVQLESRLLERQLLLDALESGDIPQEIQGELAERLGAQLEELRRIRQAVAEAMVEASTLQASLTEAHPQLQTARDRVQQLSSLYRQELKRVTEAVRQEVQVLEQAALELRRQRDLLSRRLAQAAGRYPEWLRLRSEYDVRLEALRRAALKREQARTQVAIASQSAVFVPLDPLHVSHRPVTPKDPIVAFMGGFLGLIAGIGLAFVANHYSHTVRDAGDLRRWGLDVPVLATVPAVDDPMLLEGRRKVASSRIAAIPRRRD